MLLERARGDGVLCAPQDWKIREAEHQEEQKRSAGAEQVGVALFPTQTARVVLKPTGSACASAVSSRVGECTGDSPSAGGGKSGSAGASGSVEGAHIKGGS